MTHLTLYPQIGGALEWAAAAVETALEKCKGAIEGDEAFQRPGAPGQQSPLEEIGEKLCPNDCSGKGTCSLGTVYYYYYYLHFCIVYVMLVSSISLMPVHEVCYASEILNKFKN